MDIQKENDLIQEAFEVEADEVGFSLDQKWGDYENPYENSDTALAFNLFKKGWQAAKAHEAEKLKGCVVVPKDQIEVWWQDSEEPENFATKEDDLSFIAQHIQDDEIMEINEHHTIHLPSITKFGAWVYQSGQRTFFVGNKDEVEAARGGK